MPNRTIYASGAYESFVKKNKDDWQRLAGFGNKIDAEGVREYARLLRLASYHLAYAKTHFPDSHAAQDLNRIVGGAQGRFYAKTGTGSRIAEYILSTFPAAVRDSWKYWGLATALFAFGLFFAAFYVADNTNRLHDLMPYGFADGFSSDEAPVFGDSQNIDLPLVTAYIMTNNVRVAIHAFGLGLLAGLGTVYVMVLNGLIVGGLFGFFHTVGADMMTAYSLVLPHGVLELIAIFICGGGGLMLGKGLLMPEDLTRGHSLVVHAKKAAVLMPGVIAILVIAAIIEGFFTPLSIPPEFKLVFAAITGIVFVAYCFLLQNKPEEQ